MLAKLHKTKTDVIIAVFLIKLPEAMDLPDISQSHSKTSDESLMLAYAKGDNRSFDELYSRHKGAVFRYLLRQVSSRAIAEELFQEVWMKLINARERYRADAKFTTYLYTLAHNHLIDFYRKNERHQMQSYSQEDNHILDQLSERESQQPEQKIDLSEQANAIIDVIESLPAAQRETLMLKLESDMSVEEIASATNVERETAKSRLRYALSKIRKQFSQQIDPGVSP